MSGMIDSALAIMSGAERRLATIANNVSNVTTPGFKRQVSFVEAVGGNAAELSPGPSLSLGLRSDLTAGRMTETGNPLDLAIVGDGFFRLRADDRILYSRHGQFSRADDGTMINQLGHVLQQAGGGDLVLDRDDVEILRDGNVLSGGSPVARIAVALPADPATLEAYGGSSFLIPEEAVEEVAAPELRQGMIEASNVSLGDEMAAMMIALRQAETGARLVTLYDELLGRAITTFGQTGR
jgi:flagellar basal-body rod protein FlgF